jgi:hypothetical protein
MSCAFAAGIGADPWWAPSTLGPIQCSPSLPAVAARRPGKGICAGHCCPRRHTVLATREIDPGDMATYSWDYAGSCGYWYRFTYFNRTTLAETSLTDLDSVRHAVHL